MPRLSQPASRRPDLRACRIHKLMLWVNQYNAELQTLHRVAALGTHSVFVGSISNAVTQYEGLFRWFEDGTYLLKEHDNVHQTLDAVKETVTAQTSLAKAALFRKTSHSMRFDVGSLPGKTLLIKSGST